MPNWKYIRYGLIDKKDSIIYYFTKLREWLNQLSPRVMISIASVFVFIMIIIIFSGSENKQQGKTGSNKGWFYDLNTKKLFVAKCDQYPPIKAPSGHLADGSPAGVIAHVLSYVSEPNESQRFIGYLETFTPETKQRLSRLMHSKGPRDENALKNWQKDRLICKADDKQWFSADSKEGREIITEAFAPNDSNQYPKEVKPE